MSALADYATVIDIVRRFADTPSEEPLVALKNEAVLAMADELEQRDADAALGALVRGMPRRTALVHTDDGAWTARKHLHESMFSGRYLSPKYALEGLRQKLTEEPKNLTDAERYRAALREALGEQDDATE